MWQDSLFIPGAISDEHLSFNLLHIDFWLQNPVITQYFHFLSKKESSLWYDLQSQIISIIYDSLQVKVGKCIITRTSLHQNNQIDRLPATPKITYITTPQGICTPHWQFGQALKLLCKVQALKLLSQTNQELHTFQYAIISVWLQTVSGEREREFCTYKD